MSNIEVRLGVRFALLLASANLIYQSAIWFTGLNRFEAPLFVFFMFPPIALYLAFSNASEKQKLSLQSASIIACIVATVASLLLVPTMLLFLDLLGGGILPPVLQTELANLRADTSGSAEIAVRIHRLEQLTPLGFAIRAAISTALLTLVTAMPAALIVRYRIRRHATARAPTADISS